MTNPYLAQIVAQNIPVLCWMADPKGALQWCNQAWYDYTGQSPDQAKGWGWREVQEPTAMAEVVARFTAHVAKGQPFRMVERLKGMDSVFRPFLARVRPVLRHGEVQHWFGSSTEISDMLCDDPDLRAELASLDARRC